MMIKCVLLSDCLAGFLGLMSGFALYRFPIGLALVTSAHLVIGRRRQTCFLLHIDWLTESACGCGRAAHSTTQFIHS